MTGRQTNDQSQLFYVFNREKRISASHLLLRINPIVTRLLADMREKLAPFYSDIGRPSIDPELMVRMLIVGYCYGIRFERRLCEEIELNRPRSRKNRNPYMAGSRLRDGHRKYPVALHRIESGRQHDESSA